jgi:hypothetical protein
MPGLLGIIVGPPTITGTTNDLEELLAMLTVHALFAGAMAQVEERMDWVENMHRYRRTRQPSMN